MLQHQYSISEAISKRYFQEIETMNRYDGIEKFFEIESQLLREIYQLDAEASKESLRRLIDILSERSGKHFFRTIRHYFVILSSVVTRRLIENQAPSKKAFAFNVACVEMIDQRMNDAEFLQFADDLIEFYIYVISERKQPSYKHQTVNKVIMFIDDEVETDLSVEDIALYFTISTSHLSRIFKEHVGITLVEYLNVRRVEESQYYLRHTNKSISNISEQFHFCNQSYYTRIFKKYVGLTPKHFKDQANHDYFRFQLPDRNI
ncbi:helix-turn-helix transcriptional regulator [Viridibacillus sp. YIM B01967]|uniref:Helix-turn-helix transcriptional regulator n=1 Tax=Viridibacillus soli TaxID=2798301 RepID=A0ABS1H571_9BACL|nr:response regulator transcription factor [Viridibacillus soli]MBK3494535.1 helix-turn-helix transcriptional regulator [Viridibacillus soli]